MSQFRILENVLFMDGVSISASSQDAEFPVSNLARTTRGKVWHSSGNYTVDATNNKINFKKAALGSELTATIASSSYSATSLCAAVKSALEAVSGGDVFTVSWSSATGLFTIASGGTHLELLFSSGTNAATSARSLLGYGINDFAGSLSYSGAFVALHSDEWVVVDLSTTEAIDSVAVLFDPLNGSQLSPSAVVTIQGSATNAWASPGVSQVLTFDEVNESYTHFFTADQSYRYWRLKIVDPQNPDLFVEIPKLVLSKGIQLGQTPEIGFSYKLKDMSKLTQNPYGVAFADLYPKLKGFEFNFAVIDYTDMETLANLFSRVGSTTPICLALDPDESVFDKDRFFVYGLLKNELTIKHRVYRYFDVPLTIEETF